MKTLNIKQVARKISVAERCSLEKAFKELEENGVEKFDYLFHGKLEYIGFNNYKVLE